MRGPRQEGLQSGFYGDWLQGSSRRLGEEEKEEGIWLLASSLEGLQGLTGPSPGSQLPLGPFQLQ